MVFEKFLALRQTLGMAVNFFNIVQGSFAVAQKILFNFQATLTHDTAIKFTEQVVHFRNTASRRIFDRHNAIIYFALAYGSNHFFKKVIVLTLVGSAFEIIFQRLMSKGARYTEATNFQITVSVLRQFCFFQHASSVHNAVHNGLNCGHVILVVQEAGYFFYNLCLASLVLYGHPLCLFIFGNLHYETKTCFQNCGKLSIYLIYFFTDNF